MDKLPSTKIDRLVSILEETRNTCPNDKTIVFSQFLGMLDLAEEAIRERGFMCVRFDGRMTARERDAVLSRFRDNDEIKVLLISLKCGSLGLNLTCANRVVLLDVWWYYFNTNND